MKLKQYSSGVCWKIKSAQMAPVRKRFLGLTSDLGQLINGHTFSTTLTPLLIRYSKNPCRIPNNIQNHFQNRRVHGDTHASSECTIRTRFRWGVNQNPIFKKRNIFLETLNKILMTLILRFSFGYLDFPAACSLDGGTWTTMLIKNFINRINILTNLV